MNGVGSPDLVSLLQAELAAYGIAIRGGVRFSEDEPAPRLNDGTPARSIVLLGNIGGSIWPAFREWQETSSEGDGPDPLDRWSKAVIAPIARRLGATAYFPSDVPWQPFQAWGMRAEGLRASPLGILIHPDYGLWHGYRGALGWSVAFPLPSIDDPVHPCDRCLDKPCCNPCPATAVDAIAPFAVSACRSYLHTASGQMGCMRAGCLARHACPVGVNYRYSPAQLRFHMDALKL